MDFPYGERVTITPTGSLPITDPYAEDVPTSREPAADIEVPTPVPVFPGEGSEAGDTRRPYYTSTLPMAYFPYDTPLGPHDVVKVHTGPLAGVYAVEGEPKHWKNPFTGWAPCVVAELKEYRG